MDGPPVKRLPMLADGCEGGRKRGDMWKEVSQILYEAEESLNLVQRAHWSPVSDAGQFVCVSVEATVVNQMTEAFHTVRIQIEFRFTEV